jgi:hypothetical protein
MSGGSALYAAEKQAPDLPAQTPGASICRPPARCVATSLLPWPGQVGEPGLNGLPLSKFHQLRQWLRTGARGSLHSFGNGTGRPTIRICSSGARAAPAAPGRTATSQGRCGFSSHRGTQPRPRARGPCGTPARRGHPHSARARTWRSALSAEPPEPWRPGLRPLTPHPPPKSWRPGGSSRSPLAAVSDALMRPKACTGQPARNGGHHDLPKAARAPRPAPAGYGPGWHGAWGVPYLAAHSPSRSGFFSPPSASVKGGREKLALARFAGWGGPGGRRPSWCCRSCARPSATR